MGCAEFVWRTPNVRSLIEDESEAERESVYTTETSCDPKLNVSIYYERLKILAERIFLRAATLQIDMGEEQLSGRETKQIERSECFTAHQATVLNIVQTSSQQTRDQRNAAMICFGNRHSQVSNWEDKNESGVIAHSDKDVADNESH